jgi:type IV secretion system protein VirB2
MMMRSAFLMLSMFLPELAVAGEDIGGDGELPYEAGLQSLADSMSGPVAFVISLVGIVACGAMLIFGGEISGFMRTMVFVVLVGAVIVQAGSIVALMKKGSGGGGGRSSACVFDVHHLRVA